MQFTLQTSLLTLLSSTLTTAQLTQWRTLPNPDCTPNNSNGLGNGLTGQSGTGTHPLNKCWPIAQPSDNPYADQYGNTGCLIGINQATESPKTVRYQLFSTNGCQPEDLIWGFNATGEGCFSPTTGWWGSAKSYGGLDLAAQSLMVSEAGEGECA